MRHLGSSGIFAAVLLLSQSPAGADSCRAPVEREARANTCRPEERLRPVDLDRPTPRSRANVYDDGRGTEIRVDGRVSSEFGTKR